MAVFVNTLNIHPMCGINGIYTLDQAAGEREYQDAARKMTGLMSRRGPDDEGTWTDPAGHVQFGFRRLSILDLTQAGHQPMVSGDGRSVLIFNGEIYNFLTLRHELEQVGIRFRSRSDSEVLLEGLNHWGVKVLSRLNGMFAFAWYDRTEQTLIFARDHAGIKPLYYFVHPLGKGVAFASQFNALLHTPWGEPGPVRRDVMHLYLRLHHIPPPFGLLENTYQVEPGQYVVCRLNGTIEKHRWWTLPRNPEPDLHGEEAMEALSSALDASVRRQRIADVPVGVFLSGGVDSPLITAIARSQSGPNLKAFTIGNPGWSQDESEAATGYARHLGIEHWLHPVTGDDILAAIPKVMEAQHEPFADFSILPTLLVSQYARDNVKVVLSGDGGDEVFFGYDRPRSLIRNGSDFRWPWPMRIALYAAGKYGLGPRRSDTIVHRTPASYYFSVNSRLSDADLQHIAPDLQALPVEFQLYDYDGYQGVRHLANYSRWVEYYGQMQRCLKKVDMASMHHSLEVRVPLLDREVIEVGLRIDPFTCMRNGTGKAVLREVLARHVPPERLPKTKLGFAVPLGEWLRGPLRPLVEEILFEGPLYPEGLFDRENIRHYWNDHLTGRRSLKWGLWTLLSLQWWYKKHLR